MGRRAVRQVGDVVWLDQLVHDTSLWNVEFEEVRFVDGGHFDQPVVFEGEAVQGVIFAQGAAIDAAVGKDEIVIGHAPGTFERLVRFQENFWIGDANALVRHLTGHGQDVALPLFAGDLKIFHGALGASGRLPPEADHLNEKPIDLQSA